MSYTQPKSAPESLAEKMEGEIDNSVEAAQHFAADGDLESFLASQFAATRAAIYDAADSIVRTIEFAAEESR